MGHVHLALAFSHGKDHISVVFACVRVHAEHSILGDVAKQLL